MARTPSATCGLSPEQPQSLSQQSVPKPRRCALIGAHLGPLRLRQRFSPAPNHKLAYQRPKRKKNNRRPAIINCSVFLVWLDFSLSLSLSLFGLHSPLFPFSFPVYIPCCLHSRQFLLVGLI
ncbi:hypothetical protein BDV23DRAFT_112336 [Aspergillus alliaceus]|uniref:Uncharacterized protein n=1 Tax=Petromyces alliaceus TaxID=209559 RepID=A0A5N7C386_PETAA|nr:hypothetical protein BDV23DRAFT_112336 [Aspergillus alliaceus]